MRMLTNKLLSPTTNPLLAHRMSDFWNGVGTGIATSGVVAVVVYWLQKRDADKAASVLGSKVDEVGAVSKEALRTTLEIRDITTDLHRVAAEAQRQAAASAEAETLTKEHIAKTEAFLAMAKDSGSLELAALHRMLLGEQVLYAGFVRDANVSVASTPGVASELRPLPPEVLNDRISAWQQAALALITSSPESSRGFEQAVQLHVELMRIHPFFDGNGLLGRALLAAMSRRYLGKAVVVPRADPPYFASLRAAMTGSLESLSAYLQRSGA